MVSLKGTHLPLAFSKVLFDLSADGLVDVLVQRGVPTDPAEAPTTSQPNQRGQHHKPNSQIHNAEVCEKWIQMIVG